MKFREYLEEREYYTDESGVTRDDEGNEVDDFYGEPGKTYGSKEFQRLRKKPLKSKKKSRPTGKNIRAVERDLNKRP